MGNPMGSFARAAALAAVLASAWGCAVLRPDRSVHSTLTLEPGQVASGRIEIPDGGRGLVQFHRGEPRRGPAPHPDAVTWTGDGKVTIAFLDAASGPGEGPLGYSHVWLEDGRVCRVLVRNVDARPVTFGWSVTGSSDAVATWELSGARAGD